jgi:superfamily II DNA or RNA helicase
MRKRMNMQVGDAVEGPAFDPYYHSFLSTGFQFLKFTPIAARDSNEKPRVAKRHCELAVTFHDQDPSAGGYRLQFEDDEDTATKVSSKRTIKCLNASAEWAKDEPTTADLLLPDYRQPQLETYWSPGESSSSLLFDCQGNTAAGLKVKVGRYEKHDPVSWELRGAHALDSKDWILVCKYNSSDDAGRCGHQLVEGAVSTYNHQYSTSGTITAIDEDDDCIRYTASLTATATMKAYHRQNMDPGEKPVSDKPIPFTRTMMAGTDFQLSSTMNSKSKVRGLAAAEAAVEIKTTQVKATLVVCPPTLCRQWLSEIMNHSDLKVAVYEGSENFGTSLYRPAEDADETEMRGGDFDPATFPEFDVVIVSFDTARSELEAPLSGRSVLLTAKDMDRKQHGESGYHMAPSDPGLGMSDFTRVLVPPLQQFEFWRVIVDEFQELDGKGAVEKHDSGSTWQASSWQEQRRDYYAANPLVLTTLHALRRQKSWLLSGTPLGSEIKDLSQIVQFLGYDTCYTTEFLREVFATLGHNSYYGNYGSAGGRKHAEKVSARLVERMMWRNTKKLVDDEISLPGLSTVVHTIQLPQAEMEACVAAAEECRRALRWSVADARESMEERQRFHITLSLPTQFAELFDAARLACCHYPALAEAPLFKPPLRGRDNMTPVDSFDVAGAAPADADGDERGGGRSGSSGGGAKLKALVALVGSEIARARQLQQPAEKFIVFSQWMPLLQRTQQVLQQSGVAGAVLTKRADKALDSFREREDVVCLMVCTLPGMGASGLNLTNACHAVFLEPSLSPAIEAQAIGRVHRSGQTSEVTVHRIEAAGTLEGEINALRQEKTNQFSSRSVGASGLVEHTDSFRDMARVFKMEREMASVDDAAAAGAVGAARTKTKKANK